MADPVKISDLPSLSSVQANDIIPIVDSALTQTSRCTASQIAVLGGGPPGVGTVSDEHVLSGHLTVQKLGMTSANRFPVSGATAVVDNTTGTPTTRYQGAEQPITAFGLQWLSYQNSSEAATALGALISVGNLTVSGNVTVGGSVTGNTFLAGNGTAAQPSYSFANANSTGLSFNGTALDISSGGSVKLRIPTSGALQSPLYDNSSSFLPHMGVRAWAHLHRTPTGVIAKGVGFSSYTFDGGGGHFLNFSTNMPDESYSVQVAVTLADSAGEHASYASLGTIASSTFAWIVAHNGNAAGESSQRLFPDHQCVTVVR